MSRTHLVLGHAADAHAQHIRDRLRLRGHACHLVQTDAFPDALQLSLYPGAPGGLLRLQDGTLLELDDIGSVYWRNFCGVSMETSKATRGSMADVAYYDSMASLRAWFQRDNGTRWFNSWAAFQSHQEKPHQLHLAAAAGVPVAPTYIGNDPQAVLDFCAREPDLIFKPVYGGAHSQRITAQHLEPERLAQVLRAAPITLQRYIGGTNIRTYAIGETCFALELSSAADDFRADPSARPKAIPMPDSLRPWIRSIMHSLDLNWTAIDWRLSASGDYFFLEANPSPMFMGVEEATGLPLTDTLVDALTA